MRTRDCVTSIVFIWAASREKYEAHTINYKIFTAELNL